MPLWPCLENFHGLPRIGALAKSIRLVLSPFAISAEMVWPLFLASSGLGSNVSTWLTPPCMNRWITALARAGKCGGLGASGLFGAASSIEASASAPNPRPASTSSSRLV